jgi:hypothetical protein
MGYPNGRRGCYNSFALDIRANEKLVSYAHTMSGMTIALIAAGCISAGTLLGLVLSEMVPGHHLDANSKDAVKIGAGMISTLAALVLGLLVSSAKGSYDSTNAAITEGGAKVIMLDRILSNYGAETKAVRQELRRSVAATIQMLWPEESSRDLGATSFERAAAMEKVLKHIWELRPQTEVQRALQAQAQVLANEILQIRWVQIEQAEVSLPMPFLVILLFWLTLLYTSFGLLAPRNATVITIMLLGALALATALFLIVEMSHPMAGAIKVSSAPMRKALECLGQ